MALPPRRVAPQAPLYFGGVDPSTPTAEMIAALEASLALTFTQMTDQIADAQVPQSAVTQYQADLSIAWSQLTATPTTVGGYGITDAYTKTDSDARYAPIAGPFPWADVTGAPAFLLSTGPFAWADVTGTPTTLAGYGIVDSITAATAAATYALLAGPFPWGDVSGTPTTLAGYGITDAYTKTLSDARYALLAGPFPWADVTGTPTTLAGYGITDAYTKAASDAKYALLAGPFPWSDVTGTPTTLAGYGIVDSITAAVAAATYAPLASPAFSGTVTGTFSGNITGNVTGNTSGSSGSCTGNALTATTLATARAINGVNFDGSAAITVTAASTTLTGTTLNATVVTSSLTSVGTLTSLTTSGAITLTTAAGKIIPGVTSISHRNHADSADNLLISDAGLVTVRAGLTVTTGTLTVTGGTIQMGGSFARINAGTSALQIRDNTGSNIIFSVASTTLIADYWSLEVASNAAIGVLPNSYTNWYGLHIFDPLMFTGKTITNDYGIYIESIAVGTTLNFAIFTNTGKISFGDSVTIRSGSITVAAGFGCNGATAQTAFAGGGAAPAGGTGTAAGGWDTAAHRDAAITLLNNIYTMAKNNGLMT